MNILGRRRIGMRKAWRRSRQLVSCLPSALAIAALAAGMLCVVGVRSARADSTITVVDSLNGVPTSAVFPLGGGPSILPFQFLGPEFALTQTTTITEVGGFIAVLSTQPILVEIVASANGLPDPSHVLGVFPLTVSPLLTYPQAAYESVAPNLTLPPGTYFALFGAQDISGATWWGNSSTGLLPQAITAGIWDPTTGSIAAGTFFIGARVLGVVSDISAQLEELLAEVTGVGPGSSLAGKMKLVQTYVAANDLADACSTLAAFIHEVKAQSANKIPVNQASALIASARQVSTQLGC
jgi:hypothetical protein